MGLWPLQKEPPLHGPEDLWGGPKVPISPNVKSRPSAFSWEPPVPPALPAEPSRQRQKAVSEQGAVGCDPQSHVPLNLPLTHSIPSAHPCLSSYLVPALAGSSGPH